MSRKDAKQIILELEQQGWTVTLGRGGHWRATHPLARSVMFLGSSPSDRRARANVRATARRLLSHKA